MHRRQLLTLIMSAVLLLVWPCIGMAHVHMKKSDPIDGGTLAAGQTAIHIWFSGKIDAEWSKVTVTDTDGNQVDTGTISNDDDPKHLSVGIKPLHTGQYDVKLNVISNDGHRVKGSFSFHVQ